MEKRENLGHFQQIPWGSIVNFQDDPLGNRVVNNFFIF